MIAFTYWSGEQFSLLNLISIISFARLNPNIRLIIYTSSIPYNLIEWRTGEHSKIISKTFELKELSGESNIEILKLDSNAKNYKNIKSHVHMADYIRIEKLYEHGGLWIDADILFTSSIENSYLELSSDLTVISYDNTVATGLIYCSASNPKLKHLLDKANTIINNDIKISGYQTLGPNLWAHTFLNNRILFSNVAFLNSNYVYAYKYPELNEFPSIIDFFYGPNDGVLDGDMVGVHWYNGNTCSKNFIEFHLNTFLTMKSDITPFCKVINHLKKNISLESLLLRLGA